MPSTGMHRIVRDTRCNCPRSTTGDAPFGPMTATVLYLPALQRQIILRRSSAAPLTPAAARSSDERAVREGEFDLASTESAAYGTVPCCRGRTGPSRIARSQTAGFSAYVDVRFLDDDLHSRRSPSFFIRGAAVGVSAGAAMPAVRCRRGWLIWRVRHVRGLRLGKSRRWAPQSDVTKPLKLPVVAQDARPAAACSPHAGAPSRAVVGAHDAVGFRIDDGPRGTAGR